MKQFAATSLAVVHLLSAITLLGLSAWFIAACAIAGHAGVVAGFNYVIPAAVIRFLAIIRLASGYFEKYFGHLALLDALKAIRYRMLVSAFAGDNIKQSDAARSLQQETEQAAARWTATYSPLFASACAVLGISLIIVLLFPTLILLWCLYLVLISALLILFNQLNRSAEQGRQQQLKAYLFTQRQWLHSSPLWSLKAQQQQIQGLIDQALAAQQADQKKAHLLASCELALVFLSLLWCLLFAQQITADKPLSALWSAPFILLLAVRDWLLPAFTAIAEARGNDWPSQQHDFTESAARDHSYDAIYLVLENFQWQRSQSQGLPLTATINGPALVFLAAPSGIGKSSTFLALVKELHYRGHASINGHELRQLSDRQCHTAIHHSEQFGHIFSGTLRSNLQVAADQDDSQFIEALKWAQLPDWANQAALDLWLGDTGRPISGGEQKRLLLARAYLTEANLLLLDEPFEALDSATADRIAQQLNKLAEKRLIIIASHLRPANLRVDQTIYFDDGHSRK